VLNCWKTREVWTLDLADQNGFTKMSLQVQKWAPEETDKKITSKSIIFSGVRLKWSKSIE
jgi:hypothetical protein